MPRRLFERVCNADQRGLAERASCKRDAERRWIDDRGGRRDEPAGNDDAGVTRLGWRGGAAVLRKQDGVEVVVGAFDAVRPVEDRVQTGSGEGQVLSAVGHVAHGVRASRARVELVGGEEDGQPDQLNTSPGSADTVRYMADRT